MLITQQEEDNYLKIGHGPWINISPGNVSK